MFQHTSLEVINRRITTHLNVEEVTNLRNKRWHMVGKFAYKKEKTDMQIKKGSVFHCWHFHLRKVVNSWSADSPLFCNGCPRDRAGDGAGGALAPPLFWLLMLEHWMFNWKYLRCWWRTENLPISCYDQLTWHGRISDICVGIRINVIPFWDAWLCTTKCKQSTQWYQL